MQTLVATLPTFYDWRSLLDVFGGWDPLIDAYCLGYLGSTADARLEESAGDRLQVQLLRRLIRIVLVRDARTTDTGPR